jgi:hypothetical protein
MLDKARASEGRFAPEPTPHQGHSEPALAQKIINLRRRRSVMVRRSQTVLEDDEWSASLDDAGGAPKDLQLSPLDVNLDERDSKIIWDEYRAAQFVL